jgi:hypothetical protein
MRHSLLQAAVLAGAALLGPAASMGQQFPAGASQDPYLQTSPGKVTPPLVPPAPFEPQATSQEIATPQETSAALDELAPPPPALEDFPENPGMIPDYSADSGYSDSMTHSSQPYVYDEFAMPMYYGHHPGAIMPQMIAPNMIGDFFSISGASGGSLLSIQTDSFRLSGPWQHSGSGDLIYFSATGAPGQIDLTSPINLEIRGDVNAPIPAGTVWNSANPQPGYTESFDLQENPVETAAVDTAFPGGAPATFVSGQAEQHPDNEQQYAIYTDYIIHQPSDFMTLVIPDPGAAPGALVGRQKLAENSSPIPRSRVFVNYSFFDGTALAPGGVDVSRVTPGLEYAFLGDNVSVEVRAPFASTLDSDVNFFGRTSTSEVEFGNVTGWLKALMWESDTLSWSAGVGMTIPTANDFTVTEEGTTLFEVGNSSYHVLPFLGFLWTPSERCFMQGFLQFDIDANGNPVYASSFDDGLPTGNLHKIGNAKDATYAFIDVGLGYWMYRNRHCDGIINGFAPTIELHYNATTEDAGTIRIDDFAGLGANVRAGSRGDLESTNVVLGMTAIVGTSGTLTLGYATNVGGDEQSDGEFRAYFNWFFGPQGY